LRVEGYSVNTVPSRGIYKMLPAALANTAATTLLKHWTFVARNISTLVTGESRCMFTALILNVPDVAHSSDPIAFIASLPPAVHSIEADSD